MKDNTHTKLHEIEKMDLRAYSPNYEAVGIADKNDGGYLVKEITGQQDRQE